MIPASPRGGVPRPVPSPVAAAAPAVDPGVELGGGESDFHIADYLRIVVTRWRLIAVVTGLLLALSLIQYAATPREYRATTLIKIERRVSVPLKAVQDAWLDRSPMAPGPSVAEPRGKDYEF